METSNQILVLVRHEESTANAEQQKTNDGLRYQVCGSDLQIGLSDRGVSEALARRDHLAGLLACVPIHRAWTSPFTRTTQTAELYLPAFGYQIPFQADARLSKRSYGLFWDLTYRGVEVLYPEEYARFLEQGPFHYCPPGGENYLHVYSRILSFIKSEITPSRENQMLFLHSVGMLTFEHFFEGLADEEVVRRYEDGVVLNGETRIYHRQGPEKPWQRWHPPDKG